MHAPPCPTYGYEAAQARTSGLRQHLLCALVTARPCVNGFVNNWRIPTREEGLCDFGTADQLRAPGYQGNPQNHSGDAAVQLLSRLAVDIAVVSRSIFSRSAGRVTQSSAPPRALCLHQRELVTSSVLLEGEDPRATCAVLQALCTAPSFEHTALAHEATRRSTRKIDGVRSIHTRPALGAPLRDKHCGDGSHARLRYHAVQRKAKQGVPERTPSGKLRRSSARTPRNLRPTPLRDTVPCPNRGHSLLARSNLSTTGPYNPVMPTKSSFQHAKV